MPQQEEKKHPWKCSQGKKQEATKDPRGEAVGKKVLRMLSCAGSMGGRKRARSERGRTRNGRRKKAVSPRCSHVHSSPPPPLAESRRAKTIVLFENVATAGKS